MRWPNSVQIKEVGPRDGLQNEKKWVSTDDKVSWINMLSETGVSEIEYSSFVHPKWIPALKDARDVGSRIKRNNNITYSALVPNEVGLEHALEAGIDTASVFMSVSETHNQKNINKTIEDTYPIIKNVIRTAKAAEKNIVGYVSTVFDCPFEGKVNVDDVLRICDRLFELGVEDISLGDTIGSAVPLQVENLLEEMIQHYPNKNIIMHFHDTHGMAIANIMTAMRYGITRFDSSLGGLGGCPYAPGAAGNVATNDVLYLLHGLGIKTGINEKKLNEAALFIQNRLGKRLPSRTLAYLSGHEENIVQKNEKQRAVRKRERIYIFLKNQYNRIRSHKG